MKIAFVSQPMDSVIANPNSIGIWTLETARRMTGANEVRIWCRDRNDGPLPAGPSFHPVPIALDQRTNRIARKLLSSRRADRPYFATAWYYLPYALRVASGLRAFGPDIVHLHNFSQFAPLIKRSNPGAAVILHMHCEWLTQLDRSLVSSRLRYVDRIAGCSDYITHAIASRFPERARDCVTIHNGVDTERFRPSDAREEETGTRLLFVGRVSPEKGLHDLIDALPSLNERIGPFRLDIFGSQRQLPFEYLGALSEKALSKRLAAFYEGDDRAYYLRVLKAKVDEHGLGSRVAFRGHRPQADLPGIYRRSDILVNPSLSESFGMSLIEAMASGIPVVATDTGGMPEVVSGGNSGIVVPAGDPAALSQAIAGLALDPQKRSRMGRAGRRRAMETYSWARIAADLESAYTLSGGAPGRSGITAGP